MSKRFKSTKGQKSLRRLERKRLERRLRSNAKRKARARSKSGYRHSQYDLTGAIARVARQKSWRDLRVPKTLDLIGNFQETVDFIQAIRRASLVDHAPVRLFFDRVKQIKPAALLLLLAQIHQCRLVRGQSNITGTYPTDTRLENIMDAMGFFKLLGVKSRVNQKDKKLKAIEYIEFLSERRLAQESARRLRQALLGKELSMDIIARKKLFRAISEAMTNVGQHAYPKDLSLSVSLRGRWWLAGALNKPRNELMIMFCDLGVGIPRTLPKLYSIEKIRGSLALLPTINPNDGEMIQAAMTIGRTQTGNLNRGKGLNDLRSFIDQSGAGEMFICSRHGMYRYSASGVEAHKNYEYALGGTLIQWTVPLSRVTNWNIEEADEVESDLY